MEILQFTLLASDFVLRGRTPFFAIHSNKFGKPHEVDEGITDHDEKGNKVRRTRIENGPTRKIFRTYLPQLLKEKLLVRINTNDNRSKYYSITPLGIIHLIKSSMFFDGFKYPHPERNYVILVLQTFAYPSVKPYHSIIFENQRFLNYETNFLKDISRWFGAGFRNQVPHVFSNVNIVQENIHSKYSINFMEFFITNGYNDSNKYRLAVFDFYNEEYVKIEELDKSLLNSFSHDEKTENYIGLKLDDAQFHHYLANLMICSYVFDSAIADFDGTKLFNDLLPKLKKQQPRLQTAKSFMDDDDAFPEYFLRILLLFSKHILKLSENQYKLTSSFKNELYSLQFKQPKVSNPQLMS